MRCRARHARRILPGAKEVSGLVLLCLLLGCKYDIFKCALRTGPECVTPSPLTCSGLVASQLDWFLNGFGPQDILDPDVRNPPILTAVLRVGQVKSLSVKASALFLSEDCSRKATSAQWSVSNPVVARADVGDDLRVASLVALQPGDTDVAAILAFGDGSPPVRALPYAFTNVASGNVTVVRVIP